MDQIVFYSSTDTNLDTIYYTQLWLDGIIMLSQFRWISLSAFLSFLSGLDSWINIIPELYCLSWHLTIFRACLYLSMPQWACKCSVLHRLDETKPSTRTCRNRHTFLHLLVLSTPSHVVLAINRATQQTIQNKERWFQKLVGTSPHFKITSFKLMKSSEISSVHFYLFVPQHTRFFEINGS